MNGRNVEGLACEETFIERTNGEPSIRIRIYKPLKASGKPLPVMLYCHGGGYALGNPEQSDSIMKDFIDKKDCIIVAPDYRKSINAPYPAALDDCYDTLKWIKENTEQLGARSDQIFVVGHSAGGGLTAAVSLLARDKKEVNIAFQMPIYPMIDDKRNLPSAVDNNAPFWNSKLNAFGWDLYLGKLKTNGEEIPAYAAPARAENYHDLPPTITYVVDLEPFRDETIAYVDNLNKAGVATKFKIYPGCYHGFDVVIPKAKVSKEAAAFMLNEYSEALDKHFAEQVN